MNAYLSIDLDYWMDYLNSGYATRFFNKVFSLGVPITFVIEHEELVPDMNKTKQLQTMYNVDYHSDIIARWVSMKTIKVFSTKEVAWEVFNHTNIINFNDAKYWSYHIGAFVKEAERQKSYCQEDITKAKVADAWFIENGTQDGEVILLEQS